MISAATTQFSGTPDPLPLASTRSDYGEQHQVQIGSRKVPQTGNNNNLGTETDVDAISMAIPMFLGANFSQVYMPTSPDASFTLKFKMADGYRK